MKCISIRQPWVYSIFHLGKDIENRVWSTDCRGRILVHASMKFDKNEIIVVREILKRERKDPSLMPYPTQKRGEPPDARFPLGAIVGTVDIVDCRHGSAIASDWYVGPTIYDDRTGKEKKNYGFILARPKLFKKPIPYKGQLGIFEVPDSLGIGL